MSKHITYCKIEDCHRTVHGNKLCRKHWERWRRHGNPHTILRATAGTGSISHFGYRVVYVHGKRMYEHRKVIETVIGRPLLATEHVHHLDGNKLNNHPNNLKLVTALEHKTLHATFRNQTHKQCTQCHAIKPRWEFHRDNKPHHDSHSPYCRACAQANMKSFLMDSIPNTSCAICHKPIFRFNSQLKPRNMCSRKCQGQELLRIRKQHYGY